MSHRPETVRRVDGGRPAQDRDDPPFYVGYAAQAPSALARFHRPRLLLLLAGLGFLAVASAATMRPLPEAFFEYGRIRSFEGRISADPVPSLLVERPGLSGRLSRRTRHLLTLPGKHGAGPLIEGLDGASVRLDGTLAWRGNQSLIEVVEGSVEVVDAEVDAGPDPNRDAGTRRRLRGEIVGAKCYLGVMVPGESKVHQACASLCIRGGIPPLFVVGEGDRSLAFLLVDEDGQGLGESLLPLVGGSVELEGTISRMEDWNLLRVDAASLAAAYRVPDGDFPSARFAAAAACAVPMPAPAAGRP